MPKIIEVEKIWFKYPGKDWLFRDLSMKVNDDEFVAIIGRNGSGKTTLLKILAGILKPQKGTVTVDGVPVTEGLRDRAIYLPSNPYLFLVALYPEKRPLKMSFGQTKFASIILALKSAEIILADEPTIGLDARMRREVVNEIRASGRTFIAATNDLRFAKVADSICLLTGGKAVCGEPEEMMISDIVAREVGLSQLASLAKMLGLRRYNEEEIARSLKC